MTYEEIAQKLIHDAEVEEARAESKMDAMRPYVLAAAGTLQMFAKELDSLNARVADLEKKLGKAAKKAKK